jgi:heavy metal sensor kinase
MLRARSFRLRIAALSTLLSGLVLVAFGVWAWSLVSRSAMERIDTILRDMAQQHLSFQRSPEHWASVDQSLRYVFGEENGVLLKVVDARGKVLHQSATWPAGLTETQLPMPGPMGPEPQGRPEFDPQRRGPRDRMGSPPGQGPPPWADNGDDRFRRPPPPPNQDRFGPPPDDGGMRPPPGPDQERLKPPRQDGNPPPGGDRNGRPFPPPRPLALRQPVIQMVAFENSAWQMGVFGNPEVTLYVGIGLQAHAAEMARVRTAFAVAFPAALLCIALGSWLLAGRALRPVRELTRTIAGVSAKGLNQRVSPDDRAVEFQELLLMFNAMMDRLERSFLQAVRFSADAAHELKTPLTILQGELEQALQSAPPEQEKVLSRLLEEVQRLKSIVQKLLLLATADAGQIALHREPVDFSALLEGIVEDMGILAPKLDIQSRIQEGVTGSADGDLIRQAVQNLAMNAVKHTPDGGKIRVFLRQQEGAIGCAVQNSGDIPPGDRAKVFERFYRIDSSRTRAGDAAGNGEGTGLGLSLAREIARAHGGDVTLDDTAPGVVGFTLHLPA